MLTVQNYQVAYGQSQILHGLNFNVKTNEILAVMGRNGMGKSTLMKSLIGMIPTAGGEVKLEGQDITHLKSYQRVRQGVGFVPQGRMIFPTLTVKENIETGLTSTGEKQIPKNLYELFPVLEEMQKRQGGNLSGGQQQQLAIARALASKPKLLLLDEPTEGIQPSIIREMARTLKKIRDLCGLSIIVSEQLLSFTMDFADRIIVLEKGEIVHEEERATLNEAKVAAFLSV